MALSSRMNARNVEIGKRLKIFFLSHCAINCLTLLIDAFRKLIVGNLQSL